MEDRNYTADCELEIDLSKVQRNYAMLQNMLGENCKIAAVVKANSYGLGAVMVSQTLQVNGCQEFFVARAQEGVELREGLNSPRNHENLSPQDQDKCAKIYVLDGIYHDDIEVIYGKKLIPVLNNLYQIKIWNEFARSKNVRLPCVIQVNIGMHRMGLQEQDFLNVVNDKTRINNLKVNYILGHLTSSEETENPINILQLKKFKNYIQSFGDVKATLSSSAGLFLGEDYHLDLARPGAALYGLRLNNRMHCLLNPVRLTAPIIHLQKLIKGDYIGYNGSYKAQKDLIIATIPLGYADGILRSYSNQGIICLNKLQLPIVGRVSMDYITVDVTDVAPDQIYLGQRLEILGDSLFPDQFGSMGSSFGYEVLVNLGKRYKRKYKNVSTL